LLYTDLVGGLRAAAHPLGVGGLGPFSVVAVWFGVGAVPVRIIRIAGGVPVRMFA
jgi:hypothetical protein